MEENKKAYSYAIKLLTIKDYSRSKLEKKLLERSFDSSIVQNILDELVEKGFLREDLYAEARIKAFMFKRYSMHFIGQKMAQEGVKVGLEQIAEIFDEYKMTETQQMTELIHKKIGRIDLSSLDFESKEKLKGKIIRHLLSKGHQLSLAIQMTEKAMRPLED